jgi:hypothetical protein
MLLLALATPSAVFKLPMKAVYAPIDATSARRQLSHPGFASWNLGCDDSCGGTSTYLANDGDCDDGSAGSVTSLCPLGTDSTDCGGCGDSDSGGGSGSGAGYSDGYGSGSGSGSGGGGYSGSGYTEAPATTTCDTLGYGACAENVCHDVHKIAADNAPILTESEQADVYYQRSLGRWQRSRRRAPDRAP